MIKFNSEDHSYKSVDTLQKIDWVSVTSLVSFFKPPFDAVTRSHKASRNPKSKWFGMDPAKIQSVWRNESKRSTSAGQWYHNRREEELLNTTPVREGMILAVSKPIYEKDLKYAPPQKLHNNTIYPEFLAYSLTDGICGQSDQVEVFNNRVNIRDYKTIKTFKTEGYTNWEGVVSKMLTPLSHLDDCHLVHYSLQLSLYLYMVLRHNPQFTPGTLTIEHVLFELESNDENGFPIYKKSPDGGFIVEDIQTYVVPYMKQEVYAMMEYYHNNKEKLNARKDI